MEVIGIISLAVSGILIAVLVVLLGRMKELGRKYSEQEGRESTMREALERQHQLHIESLKNEHRDQMQVLTESMKEQSREVREAASSEFRALSETILTERQKSLQSANLEGIGSVLNPLKLKLDEFERRFKDVCDATHTSQSRLEGEIKALLNANESVRKEANNLADALRGNSKVQGDWGETVLQTLLEHAGLVKDINYSVQVTRDEGGNVLQDAAGKKKRPDVILFLPENRSLIIDSKVSLSAYLDWTGSEQPDEKKRHLKRLADSVRKHIDEIAAADYPAVVNSSVDFVLMFMPNEGAYFAIFQEDPQIWQYAYKHKVMIATPTHLFSVVQLVAQLWRHASIDRNAKEMAVLSGELFDKFVDFTKRFEDVGKELGQASEAYKKCRNSLVYGKNSLTRRADVLRQYGAETQRTIPSRLMEDEELPAEELPGGNVSEPEDGERP